MLWNNLPDDPILVEKRQIVMSKKQSEPFHALFQRLALLVRVFGVFTAFAPWRRPSETCRLTMACTEGTQKERDSEKQRASEIHGNV